MQASKYDLKVAMLGTLPPLRGISAYCRELALALAAMPNTHVEFISFASLYPAILYPGDSTEDPSLPPAEAYTLNHRRQLKWYNPLTWIIEGLTVRADVLHVNWWSWVLAPVVLTVVLLFRLRRIPVLMTVHDVVPHEQSHFTGWVHGLVIRLADHYVVHAKGNIAQMIKHHQVTRDRISQIPHGVLDCGKSSENGRQTMRNHLKLDEQQLVILLFGAIRAYKGLDTLIAAFPRVLQSRPRSVLLVVGKCWVDWNDYQRQIDALGIGDKVFSLTDYIPNSEVSDYFMAADLVVLPYHHFSSQTGVGMLTLSFNKPVIVTNVGGLPDLVKNPRCVVPPSDPGTLAEAICWAFETPERLQELSANSADLAESYRWGNIASRTVELYRDLMGRNFDDKAPVGE